jgi:Tol biopolymer transport system component
MRIHLRLVLLLGAALAWSEAQANTDEVNRPDARPRMSADAVVRLTSPPVDAGSAPSERRQSLKGAAPLSDQNADKLFGMRGGCNGEVRALVTATDGRVYIGGQFTVCDDVLALGIAVYDPTTRRFSGLGSGAVGVSIDGGEIAAVHALVIRGGDLYVGGRFDHAGGVPANNLARWNGSAWSPLAAGVDDEHGIVMALAASADELYVGGEFQSAGGQPANNIARWNGSGWFPLLAGTQNGLGGGVLALAISGSQLYAGGRFTHAGGELVNYVARWDGSAWSGLVDGVGGTSQFQSFPNVQALAIVGNDLYVGGNFLSAGRQSVNGIARWDGRAWSPLATGVGGVNGPTVVSTITLMGAELYAGGIFDTAGGQPANFVARWNGAAWSSLGTGAGNGVNHGQSGTVKALARSAYGVYVGGYFDYAGDLTAHSVAHWDGDSWLPLGAESDNGLYSRGDRFSYTFVDSTAVSADSAYVGGRFNGAGGQIANNIARWNGSRWSALGVGVTNGVDGDVYALQTVASGLYVGGNFGQAGGQPASRIAHWNGTRWSPLGTGLSAGNVSAIAVVGPDVYAAGAFDQAGGLPARNIARWNGSAWSPLGSGVSAQVRELVVMRGDLYAAGDFRKAGGVAVNGVARWDGDTWSAPGGADAIVFSGSVLALAVLGDDLYAAGYLAQLDPQAYTGIARWNGSVWSVVGTGVVLHVEDMTVLGGDLLVRGLFSLDGGQRAYGFARWNGSMWQISPDPGDTSVSPSVLNSLTADAVSPYYGSSGMLQTPLPEAHSRTLVGAIGNGASRSVVISGAGGFVGFASEASNLVAGDSNGRSDVFVRNLQTGAMIRASAVAEGISVGVAQAFADPALSADGARVAFAGSSGQIYASIDGQGRVLSRAASGALGNGPSGKVHLPGAGTLALFESQATNLLSSIDGNASVADIFRVDLPSGAMTLVSRGPAGEPANGASSGPWASADGQTVVFATLATNLVPGAKPAGSVQQAVLLGNGGAAADRLYLSRNLGTGELGDGHSANVRITPDGRYGVFESLADNLVAGDSNGVSDVFRFEITGSGVTGLEMVSKSRYGYPGNGASRNPTISDDGLFVSFETAATNLIELDRNGVTDILVKWMVSGEILRLSGTADGLQPDGDSLAPAISGDGTTVAFSSAAGNLIAADDNNVADIFTVKVREPTRAIAVDEPILSRFALPAPDPANANCPAGFFAAIVDDGPGADITAGAFGMEVLLDEPGTRVLAGGLNFGGLIDLGQVGFAGFNIQNANNEAQRVNLSLTGSPASSNDASLPVRVRVSRRTATSTETVFTSTPTIALATAYQASIDVSPGFYEVTVSPLSGEAGGVAEGQFYFSMTTSFLDRPGGGFEGGAVVGGYHAAHPFAGVSGFAAFCLATPHSTSIRVLSQPSYGSSGARDLRLRIQDAQQRDLLVVPAR